MKHSTKVVFFILFVVNSLVCYRISRQVNKRIDKILFIYEHTPPRLSVKLDELEQRVYYLEQNR